MRLVLRSDERFDRARSVDALVDAFLSGLRTNFASLLDGPFERPVDVTPALSRVDCLGCIALNEDVRESDFVAVEDFFFDERALFVEGRLDRVLDRVGVELALLLRLGARDLDA